MEKEQKPTKPLPVSAVLTGSVLTHDAVLKWVPYLLFLVAVALVYIANGFMAEASVRRINSLQQEIKELRSEQISIKSELNNTIIESELINTLNERNLGLTESFDPPQKLVVDADDLNRIN